MAGAGELSAEFNIDDEKIISEAEKLLRDQKNLQSRVIEDLKEEEKKATGEVFADAEQKSMKTFEKRKKELEDLYRLNEESFRKKTTDEDRYEFNKVVIQSQIEGVSQEIEQKRRDLGIETVEGVASRKDEVEGEILSKRSGKEEEAAEDALKNFLKTNQLDFEDRKEKLNMISQETYRSYREGKIQEREYERNTAIVNKQLRNLERKEEESYSKETWDKVSRMEQKAKGTFGTLAKIFGIGITGFGIYELISHLKIAVEEINVVNKGIQEIAARGGRTIEDLGAVVRQQLYGEIKDIREWTLLPLQEITSLMGKLRAGGRIEIESVGTIASEVILESLKTGMDKLRIAELYNEMSLKLDIPTSKLTSAFDGLYETAMNLKRPMEDHVRDVMAVSTGLRRYGFDLGTAQGIVAEFSEELEKGILATQDLINVQLMQRRMTEGRRAFAAMRFMEMPEEEAEGLGVGAVQKYLRDVREREGVLGVSTAVRLLAEGLPAGGHERRERFEKFGPLYEEAAKEGGDLPVAAIVKAELAARGYREEERPLEYRRMREMLTEAIGGLTVGDKMWEAGEKMLEAAGRQEKAALGFGESVNVNLDAQQKLKEIYESQHTIWEKIGVAIKNRFMDVVGEIELVLYDILDLIPGIDVGYYTKRAAMERRYAKEPSGVALARAEEELYEEAQSRLRGRGVVEPSEGYPRKEIERGVGMVGKGEALEIFLRKYYEEIPTEGEEKKKYLSDFSTLVEGFSLLSEHFKEPVGEKEGKEYRNLYAMMLTLGRISAVPTPQNIEMVRDFLEKRYGKSEVPGVGPLPSETKPLSERIGDGEILTAEDLITSSRGGLSEFPGRFLIGQKIRSEKGLPQTPSIGEKIGVEKLLAGEVLSTTNIESINVDLNLTVPEKESGDYVTAEDLEELRREINEEIVKSRRFTRG